MVAHKKESPTFPETQPTFTISLKIFLLFLEKACMKFCLLHVPGFRHNFDPDPAEKLIGR